MPKETTRKFAVRIEKKAKAKKARSLVLSPLGVGETIQKGKLVGKLTIPVHEMHDSLFLKKRLKEVTPWRMKQDEFLEHMGVQDTKDLPKYMQEYMKKKKLKSFSRKELADFLSYHDTIELIARAKRVKKGKDIMPISTKRYTKGKDAPEEELADIFNRIGKKRRKVIALKIGTGAAAGVFILGTTALVAHEGMKHGVIPDVEFEPLKQLGNFIYGAPEKVYDAAGGLISDQGTSTGTEPVTGGGISDQGTTPAPSGGGEPGFGSRLLQSIKDVFNPEKNLRDGKLPMRGAGTAIVGGGTSVARGVAAKFNENLSIRKNGLDHLELLNIAAEAPYGEDGFKKMLKPGSKLALNDAELKTMQSMYNNAVDNKRPVMVWYDEKPLGEFSKALQKKYKSHAKNGRVAVVNWAIEETSYPGRGAKVSKRPGR